MPPKTRAPKEPKPPKPVKLSKKSLDELDKAEIRHMAVRAMGLSPNDGAYRFKPSELTNWVLANQHVFAQADLSLCQESVLRPGVLSYMRALQANLRGEGPPATWPPHVHEPPQPDEQELPMAMDHDFSEMDDDEDEDLPEDTSDDVLPETPTNQPSAETPADNPPEVAAEPTPTPPPEMKEQEVTDPRPLRKPVVLPPPARKPGFMPVQREPPKPAPAPEPAEQPGLITENLNNMSNRMNELFDKLEMLSNLLDSRHQQLKSEVATLSAKSRTEAIERSIKRLEENSHLLTMAVLHIINTIRPWAESGIATFPNLESLPDASMYGNEIVHTDAEDSHG